MAYVRRGLAGLTTAVALLALTGCQEREVERVSVDAAGGVTVVDVTTATLAAPSARLTSKAPDVAALRRKAEQRTLGYVGAGVGKPVVSLHEVSTHRFVLSVSQHFDSVALLNAHYLAFDPAVFLFASSKKPSGPTVEALEVVDGGRADGRSGTGPNAVKLTHQGKDWSFVMNLGPKAYESLQFEAKDNPGGVYHSGTVDFEIHVKLPGHVVSTNGRRLAGGLVSWNLYALTTALLTVTTRQ